MDWKTFLESLRARYEFKTRTPLPQEVVGATLSDLGGAKQDLNAFYCTANGLCFEWFRILPIEDPKDIRHTWDGIKRANDPKITSYFQGSLELLNRFLVFSDIGRRKVGVLDRNDGRIWYEEDNELNQTDLSLAEYIEACLKEIADERLDDGLT